MLFKKLSIVEKEMTVTTMLLAQMSKDHTPVNVNKDSLETDSIATTSKNVILVLMDVMTMLLAQMSKDHTLVNVNLDSLGMTSTAH